MNKSTTKLIITLTTLIFSFSLLIFRFDVAYSQCPIAITGIDVTTASGAVNGITVQGTSGSCDSIFVKIQCQGNLIATKKLRTTSTTTTWSVNVTAAEINNPCQCPAKIAVEAICRYKNSDKCIATLGEEFTECENCSRIDSVKIQPLNCSDRRTDGAWPVSVSIYTHGASPSSITIFFGDEPSASSGTSVPIPSPYTSPVTITHNYVCPRSIPDYNGSIVITTAECVNPSFSTFNINFPECECPSIDINANLETDCTVKFKATTTACLTSIFKYVWNFGDRTTETTEVPETTHTYSSNGSYTASVVAIGAGDNCGATLDITLTNCRDCEPDCNGRNCGTDGCGGSCGTCPNGKTCINGSCDEGGGGGGGGNGDDCGWKFWKCFDFNFCWLLAMVVALVVAARLILLANYGTSISLGSLSVNLDIILEALGLTLIIIALAICPCEVPIGIIIGVIIAAIWLLIQWYYTGTMPPYLISAVVIAVGLIVSAIAYREIRC